MKKTPARKQRILDGSGGRCAYCAIPLDLSSMTIDHVQPRTRGGTSALENLVAACVSCNCTKKDKTADEYREWFCDRWDHEETRL